MRTPLLSILAFGLLALSPWTATAQDSPTPPAPDPVAADPGLEAMAKLAGMVGDWEGTGWMRQGPGEPNHTRGTETVESRLEGRILVVEGRHWAKDDASHLVHHAFGVISYDAEAGHYRFQTHLATGRSGDHEMRLEGDAILWFMDTPRGKIRYTIRIQDGTWNEVGEFSPDGEQWRQFFGMDLQAVR